MDYSAPLNPGSTNDETNDSILMANRLGRLVRLQGSDPGFFVLAIHSFVEAWLRKHLRNDLRSTGFGDLVYSYRQELRQRGSYPEYRFSVLGEMARFHDLTNAVRHGFKSLYPDEAVAATERLCRFCELAGITAGSELKAMKNSMRLWDERTSHYEAHQKMESLAKELAERARRDEQQACTLNEYRGLTAERDELAREQARLQKALEDERGARRAKDEKYDDTRRKAAALAAEMRRLDDRLDEMTEARDIALDLTRMTLYTRSRLEYENELARLTPDQQGILNEIDLGSDFLIKGGAGTGKTLILLKALARHLEESKLTGQEAQKQYVFITYSDTLVKYDRYIASIIDVAERNQRIQPASQYLETRFQQILPSKRIDMSAFCAFAQEAAIGSRFDPADIMFELETFVFANNVTEAEYCIDRIDRSGLRVHLDAQGRLEMWKVRDRVVGLMEREGLYSQNYARVRLACEADASPELKDTDIVFVDEVQDLAPCDLMALKALCRGPVIMAGDNEQAIFRKGFSFRRAGLDIVGRSRTIKMNFRNTLPINELAERFRERVTPDLDSLSQKKAYERPSQAFRPGPPPSLVRAAPGQDMLKALEDRMRLFLDLLGYEPETITILVPSQACRDELQGFLASKDIPSVSIEEPGFSFHDSKGVRLSCMKSAKGIDFAVTILFIPSLPAYVADYDAGYNQAMIRNTLYVCLTRSMEQLAVIMPEHSDDQVLSDLAAAFDGVAR